MYDYELDERELTTLWNFKENLNYSIERFSHNEEGHLKIVFKDTRTGLLICGKPIRRLTVGEGYYWTRLRHRNIATLYDIVPIPPKVSIFMTPYLKRTLRDVIHDEHFIRNPHSWQYKKLYLQGVLRGLNYLHGKSLGLLNISDTNIFVCEITNKAVITDFSHLVCVKKMKQVSIDVPLFYKAPEVREYNSNPNLIAIDIWAAGILAFNVIVQHMVPWALVNYDSDRALDLVNMLNYRILKAANPRADLDMLDLRRCKAFLSLFLQTIPDQRCTAKKAIGSTFLQFSSQIHFKGKRFASNSNRCYFGKANCHLRGFKNFKTPVKNTDTCKRHSFKQRSEMIVKEQCMKIQHLIPTKYSEKRDTVLQNCKTSKINEVDNRKTQFSSKANFETLGNARSCPAISEFLLNVKLKPSMKFCLNRSDTFWSTNFKLPNHIMLKTSFKSQSMSELLPKKYTSANKFVRRSNSFTFPVAENETNDLEFFESKRYGKKLFSEKGKMNQISRLNSRSFPSTSLDQNFKTKKDQTMQNKNITTSTLFCNEIQYDTAEKMCCIATEFKKTNDFKIKNVEEDKLFDKSHNFIKNSAVFVYDDSDSDGSYLSYSDQNCSIASKFKENKQFEILNDIQDGIFQFDSNRRLFIRSNSTLSSSSESSADPNIPDTNDRSTLICDKITRKNLSKNHPLQTGRNIPTLHKNSSYKHAVERGNLLDGVPKQRDASDDDEMMPQTLLYHYKNRLLDVEVKTLTKRRNQQKKQHRKNSKMYTKLKNIKSKIKGDVSGSAAELLTKVAGAGDGNPKKKTIKQIFVQCFGFKNKN